MTPEERAAACDILKYLAKEPDAKHTAEGIARYWIFQQRLEEKVEIVMSAIDFLVREGFLEEVTKEDHERYYRLNEERINAINEEIKKLQAGSI